MARKAKTRSSGESGAKAAKPDFDVKDLSKGQLRKLSALRKSVGERLGDETFAKWLKKQRATNDTAAEDKNATLLSETLLKLISEKKLRIPRGGYLVTRGRGRVIVTRAKGD